MNSQYFYLFNTFLKPIYLMLLPILGKDNNLLLKLAFFFVREDVLMDCSFSYHTALDREEMPLCLLC